MPTTKQKRDTTYMKGFPMRYQDDFDRRWRDAVERIRGSGSDLGKISLSIGWSGTRKG